MTCSRPLRLAAIGLAILAVTAVRGQAADDNGDELVETIVNLLSDKDKDLRAVGLEQVREQAEGPAATRRFAALLPKLCAEAQIGLLDALADRGDHAARPAVVGMLKSEDPMVRAAAIRARGPWARQSMCRASFLHWQNRLGRKTRPPLPHWCDFPARRLIRLSSPS